MGRTGLAVVALGLVVGLGGCAGADGASSGTPSPIDSQQATRTFAGGPLGDSTEPLTTPVFPLTLHRTGGIAGYDDTVVLHADGKVLVDTRSVHGRVCQLTTEQQRHLLSLLNTLRLVSATGFTAPGSTEGIVPVPPDVDGETGNDAIVIDITDHKLRPLDLSDPSLGEVAGLVGALVADVTLSSPAATECVTPTSPTPAPAT